MAQKQAKDLLRLFREAWKVSPDALEALEFMWTGNQREDLDLYGPKQSFCAAFTVAAYFLSDWEQVLELTYVAIAEDALEDLKSYVDLQQPIHVCPSELPTVGQEKLVGYFRRLRESSARSKLHAAMTRRCLSSRLAREIDCPDAFFLNAAEHLDNAIRYRLDVTMLPDPKRKARQLVAAVYNQCKRGMRDPEESFLRISSTYDNTPWDLRDMPSIWAPDGLSINDGALYILLSSNRVFNKVDPSICVYVLDDTPAPQAFPLNIDSLQSYFMLQTSQQRNLSFSQIEWNVKNSAEPVSRASTWFRPLLTQYHGTAIGQSRPKSNIDTEITKRPRYHATRELPPHLRSQPKAPQGHWVTFARSSNPYQDFQPAAGLLVARKHNVELVTCLFADPQVAGRAGLRSEISQDTTARSREEEAEDIKQMKEKVMDGSLKPEDMKIENIMYRGDPFRRPDPKRKRERDFGQEDQREETGTALGDWLTDQEIELNIKAGTWAGDVELSHVEHGDRDVNLNHQVENTESPQKRPRLGDAPAIAVDTSAERPTAVKKASRGVQKGPFQSDHATDEEFEALLEADYFGTQESSCGVLENQIEAQDSTQIEG